MAKLTKDGKNKKSSLIGREASGMPQHPTETDKMMKKALKNTGKTGKK